MARFFKNPRLAGAGVESAVYPTGGSSLRPSDPAYGSVRYNLDTDVVEIYNGSAWRNQAAQGLVTISKSVTVGDGANATFTLSSFTPAFTLPDGYIDEKDLKVFVGGIYQEPMQDYEVNAGTGTITFGSAPGNTLRIVVISGENSTQVS